MNTPDDSVLETARQYLQWDTNVETKAQIADYLSEKNHVKLSALLNSRLAFGTAGLRGPMGPGYNRMNDLVIVQTTQGIAKYLLNQLGTEAKSRGVVIGYDHRRLGSLSSKEFARICAAVFLSQGFKVYLLEGFVPTPFVAFAVPHLNCAAGFMVTASHNPKEDNGFKVYWGNGSQIIPPHDTGIAQSILSNLEPWELKYDSDGVLLHSYASDVTDLIADAYYSKISYLCHRKEANIQSNLEVVYTAMHGVGDKWIHRSCSLFGHNKLFSVPSQSEPNPDFPTVNFPNPEEKGALDEAILFANENQKTLIIANDPDADRLAVAELCVETSKWYVFTGNELGVLLGQWQIIKWKELQCGKIENLKAAVLASVVSSRMLQAVALAEGVDYFETLTGFKWIGNKALQLKAENYEVLFSYEEALGYCVGDVVADKDGVSAAAVFIEMASELNEKGVTVYSHLQSLLQKYGQYVSYNSYLISRDTNVTDKIFERIRNGGIYWTQFAGEDIVSIKDVTMGYDSTSTDGILDLPITKDSHMIMFQFKNKVSLTLRTSGTEPKIKFYSEIFDNRLNPQSKKDLEIELQYFVSILIDEMLQPVLNHLSHIATNLF
eukprot:CAMPEP_0119044244 /NCGR_PEP_ID=MMETSP1177-20130426/29921_1 /TAXON_ID=2985 /ORGANISM="Ochromonas sp, Strain CCMP1899" /LENGTH=605 /DNA_ID=CAMNT_0007014055 /DNA_START=182 /DNA_END=1999 /DNA_ORIENTATION=+